MTSPMLTEKAIEAAAAASEWDLEAGPTAFLAAQDRAALAETVNGVLMAYSLHSASVSGGQFRNACAAAVDALLGDAKA